MTLLDHRSTATTKKLDFKNSHLTSVGATSQLEGKMGIGVSIAPPEVKSFPQRSHPK
jgi:hypothetical protein